MSKTILLLITFTILQLSMFVDASEPIKYEYEFTKGKLNFVVSVPEGFKLAESGMTAHGLMMGEHIPQNESITDWSEIMTVVLNKCSHNPWAIMNRLANSFKGSDPKCTTQVDKTSENGVPVVYGIIDQLSNIPGLTKSKIIKHEILGIKVISNNENTWIIQYAVRYDSKNTNEEQKEAIKKKVKTLLEKSHLKSI